MKVFFVSYANTLFITCNGQVHAIPMRWEAKKERMLSALQFSMNKKAGYLATFKRDEGPMCVTPSIPPRKLASGRKRIGWKARCKHTKGRRAEKNTSCQPNQGERTLPRSKALKRHAYEDQVAMRTSSNLVGKDVTDRSKLCLISLDFFRACLECSIGFHILLHLCSILDIV